MLDIFTEPLAANLQNLPIPSISIGLLESCRLTLHFCCLNLSSLLLEPYLGRLPPIFVTGNLPFPGCATGDAPLKTTVKIQDFNPKKTHRRLSRNPIPISHPLENPQLIYQLDTHNFDQPHLQPFSKSLEAGTSHLFGRRVHLPGDVHRGYLNQLQ